MVSKAKVDQVERDVARLLAESDPKPRYIVLSWGDGSDDVEELDGLEGVGPVKTYVAPDDCPDWQGPDEWPGPSRGVRLFWPDGTEATLP